jgi:hypothetical protein
MHRDIPPVALHFGLLAIVLHYQSFRVGERCHFELKYFFYFHGIDYIVTSFPNKRLLANKYTLVSIQR